MIKNQSFNSLIELDDSNYVIGSGYNIYLLTFNSGIILRLIRYPFNGNNRSNHLLRMNTSNLIDLNINQSKVIIKVVRVMIDQYEYSSLRLEGNIEK